MFNVDNLKTHKGHQKKMEITIIVKYWKIFKLNILMFILYF